MCGSFSSPAKDGVDAGELCGEGSTGVVATTDRDAALGLRADCCIYMPRATGRGHTRAGLTEDELVEDVVALLHAGTNVVSTCSDLFARGVRLSSGDLARVEAACANGNASVWASGSDLGFVTETLPLAFLSIQREVDLIEIEEFGDLSHRPSAHMVLEQMRFGKPLGEFDPERRRNHLFGEYQPPLSVLADLAGFEIDAWVSEGGVAAAKRDVTIVAGDIKAGTAAAQRVIVTGRSRGAAGSGSLSTATWPWTWIPIGACSPPVGGSVSTAMRRSTCACRSRCRSTTLHRSSPPTTPMDWSTPFPTCAAPAPGCLTTEDLPHVLPRAVPAGRRRVLDCRSRDRSRRAGRPTPQYGPGP